MDDEPNLLLASPQQHIVYLSVRTMGNILMSGLNSPRILVFHGMHENADEYLSSAGRAWPTSRIAVVQMNRSTMGDWRTATLPA